MRYYPGHFGLPLLPDPGSMSGQVSLAPPGPRERDCRSSGMGCPPYVRGAPGHFSEGFMTFADLKLPESLLRAVSAEGYTTPTPIQTQAIPPALEGRDVLGVAQTGTGKTAAFALPILHRLSRGRP